MEVWYSEIILTLDYYYYYAFHCALIVGRKLREA